MRAQIVILVWHVVRCIMLLLTCAQNAIFYLLTKIKLNICSESTEPLLLFNLTSDTVCSTDTVLLYVSLSYFNFF